jgi:hypothetical protein
MSPEQLVLEIMGDILELIETHRGHGRAFYEHQRELPETAHAEMAKKRARYEDAVIGTIRRGTDEGVFRRVDPKLATLAIFGVCNWAYQWYREDGDLRARESAYVFWDLLLNGLADRADP